MKRFIYSLGLGCGVWLTTGCSVLGQADSFTLTADLPPDFTYTAIATYVPVKGQTCTPGKRDTTLAFNQFWRSDYVYQPTHDIPLYRTASGCALALHNVALDVKAAYGKARGDSSGDYATIAVRDELLEATKGTFDAAGESKLSGQCQWSFRTMGKPRILTKLLTCKKTDAQGTVTRGHPFAAYTLDQLPGKTVKLSIKLAEEEKPAIGDTWVKVPGGWKRCMGDNFEDQYAFCYGNHTDFSTFKMVDGRVCTIYPGCTENKEQTP
ncbi:hypothetical protein ACIQVE_10820 [Pseudomonas sp. NPDC098747]|uniref:hypothetical protein n=1 Tax=Pseudomonas sp. NPDC098747 TaxID=3364487 RepID=UPI00383B98EB